MNLEIKMKNKRARMKLFRVAYENARLCGRRLTDSFCVLHNRQPISIDPYI